MQVRLNDREMEALQGLPWFARCLYVFGIRPYMDYRTGTVGIVRGVSWQSIAEALYVEPHQGETDSGTPDKSRVRRAAARLEKAGLVVLRSMDKRLVFQCLLADTDQSAPNKPDTNPTQTRHSEADTANPNNGAAFPAEPDTNPTHPEPVEPDTPPVSGIRKDSLSGALRFADFWSAYPKKRAKKPCLAKWKAKRLDDQADRIIADVQARLQRDRRWLDGFAPDPLTYLNQERWDDEYEGPQPRPAAPRRKELGHD